MVQLFLDVATGAGITVCPRRRHSSAAASALPVGTRIQSVGKVEIVNTLIPASARGPSSMCSTPASENSRGPSTANAVNGPSCFTFFGTERPAQTTVVSVAVALIENSEADSAQAGTSAPGGRPATII